MTSEELRQTTAELGRQIPSGRAGTPGDITKVAVFLASSAADYIAGEIVVDGGRLLKRNDTRVVDTSPLYRWTQRYRGEVYGRVVGR